MATATAPATTPEIDVRWELANYGRPQRLGKDHTDQIALYPTRRHERIGDALEEIAASLIDDGVWEEEMQECDDNLEDLIGTTWEAIEKLFKAWAARRPARLDAIHAQWAVEKAEEAEKAGTAA